MRELLKLIVKVVREMAHLCRMMHRLLRRIWYRLSLLPRWTRWVAIVVVIALAAWPHIQKHYEYRQEVKRLHAVYYTHFHNDYIQKTTPERAHYYADYYADYYAEYFTSEAYRNALRYALPTVVPKGAEKIPVQRNASLYLTGEGLQLIKRFEGLVLDPYIDAAGKLTVGYGHLVRAGESFGALTPAQAEALLREDVKIAEVYVKRLVRVPLNPNQFSALTSLVYNIGPTQFGDSTLRVLLNEGDYAGAAEEFAQWKYAGGRELKGLSRRRAAEEKLFLQRWG